LALTLVVGVTLQTLLRKISTVPYEIVHRHQRATVRAASLLHDVDQVHVWALSL